MRKVIFILTMLTCVLCPRTVKPIQTIGGRPFPQGNDTGRVAVQFSPVPLWPADGRIPSELSNRHVFYDAAADEVVIAFPSNLGSPDFDKDPGSLKLYR